MASTSIVIDAAPEVVWHLVADVTRMGEWSPETQRAEWIDGATGPTVGARFKGRNRRRASWTTTCTVTAAEPGELFTFEVGRDTRWSYRFEPVDGGCRVTESFEILRRPGPVGRWSTKLAVGVRWSEREADLVQGMEETLRRLKAGAERTRGNR